MASVVDRERRAAQRVAPLVLAVLLACGGPSVPLDVVGKAVPINVSFGSPTGALPVVGVQPVPGGFIVIPEPLPPNPLPRIRLPQPPEPPGPCPKASPFAFPARAVTQDVPEPPAAARYPFRVTGERTEAGVTRRFPAAAVRTVGNIGETVTGDLRFDVSEVAGAEATISSYRVTSSEIGLTALQRVVGGKLTTFEPVTPLQILPLPPRKPNPLGHPIDTWETVATDPATQTTVTAHGAVVGEGKERIDACGELIDTWLVELNVRTVSPTEDTTATWRLNVATQYGGLIVAESIDVEGVRGGHPYRERRSATISEVPRG